MASFEVHLKISFKIFHGVFLIRNKTLSYFYVTVNVTQSFKGTEISLDLDSLLNARESVCLNV